MSCFLYCQFISHILFQKRCEALYRRKGKYEVVEEIGTMGHEDREVTQWSYGLD